MKQPDKHKIVYMIRVMGYTQGQFANEKLNKSRQALYNTISRGSCRLDSICAIADALGVELNEILMDKP